MTTRKRLGEPNKAASWEWQQTTSGKQGWLALRLDVNVVGMNDRFWPFLSDGLVSGTSIVNASMCAPIRGMNGV